MASDSGLDPGLDPGHGLDPGVGLNPGRDLDPGLDPVGGTQLLLHLRLRGLATVRGLRAGSGVKVWFHLYELVHAD